MRLVYKEGPRKGKEVEIGHKVPNEHGGAYVVQGFLPPHKPSSSGKVIVKAVGSKWEQEFYVGVIGAHWIEREDQLDKMFPFVVNSPSDLFEAEVVTQPDPAGVRQIIFKGHKSLAEFVANACNSAPDLNKARIIDLLEGK